MKKIIVTVFCLLCFISSAVAFDEAAEMAAAGYPNPVNYEIPPTSFMIDRTYYFDEEYTFMFIPWLKDYLPHGATETDNSLYLQFGDPYIGDIIYQYGLENQSRQFQEGATFGIHEMQAWSGKWYDTGYADGQESSSADPAPAPFQYPNDQDDGTYETAYNTGYQYGLDMVKASHAETLPSAALFLSKLRDDHIKSGKTSLADQACTFEAAFDEGCAQSEKDFYSRINTLIKASGLPDDTQALRAKSYDAGLKDGKQLSAHPNGAGLWIPVCCFAGGGLLGYLFSKLRRRKA